MSVQRNNNNRRKSYSNNRPSNYRGGNRGGGNPAQIRKNATHNKTRYLDLAKNALLEGDKVTAENFFQHVHHYDTVLQELDEANQNKQNAEKRNPRPPRNPKPQQKDENNVKVEAEAEGDIAEKSETSEEEKKPKRQPRKKAAPRNKGRHEDVSISEEEALLIMPQGIPGAVATPSPTEKNSGDE